MKSFPYLCLFLALVVLMQTSPVLAQPASGKIIKGQVKTNAHPYKMEKSNAYLIQVETNGFTPAVDVIDDKGSLANRFGTGKTAELLFLPKQTADYHILITPTNYSRLNKGENTYKLTVNVAQFKPATTVKKELTESGHMVKMQQGHAYFVTLRSQIFKPELRILVDGEQIHAKVGKKADKEYVIYWTHVPEKTVNAKLLITSSPYDPIRIGARYSLNIEAREPLLLVKGKLTTDDKKYPQRTKSYFKSHAVKLKAGHRYQISMMAEKIDSYLVLEDGNGKILGQNDDGGIGFHSRLYFTPKADGDFRVIATTFAPAATGDYLVSVVEVPKTGK